MNGEQEGPGAVAATGDTAPPSRPWTPEAAMEPVPPLAPPPARPGAGTPIVITPRAGGPAAPARTLVTGLVLAVVIAGLIVLLIVLGH